MNKIILSSILSLAGVSAFAQSSYDAANYIQQDLNGTARYVGMGGALNALGADISVMNSNPAGTALYRKSDIAISASALVSGTEGQLGSDRSRMSFDQGGAVFAFQVDDSGRGLQYVNFGVNYKKSRNFFGNTFADIRNLLTYDSAGQPNYLSQTFQLADIANINQEIYENDLYYQRSVLAELTSITENHGSILDYDDEKGEYYGVGAQNAHYKNTTKGGTSQIDVNISANTSDRFYYGLSVGIYNLKYHRESFYKEKGIDGYFYDFNNWYETSGSGIDVKLGFICRPIEDSPFRFGLSVHTPTWYNLTDANGAQLYYNDSYIGYEGSGDYEYKLRTPWKFNVSLGHTIGSKIAIGAEYELTDFSTAKYSPTNANYSDRDYLIEINKECVNKFLRPQHTVKIGAEYRPTDYLSLRAGYNFLSSPYKSEGYRNILYYEPFTDTDFTNWGGINRITCGAGINWKGGYFDLAYQYQMQKGDFYAFDDYYEEYNPNTGITDVYTLIPTTIKNNRSQILATLGFRF